MGCHTIVNDQECYKYSSQGNSIMCKRFTNSALAPNIDDLCSQIGKVSEILSTFCGSIIEPNKSYKKERISVLLHPSQLIRFMPLLMEN